MGFDELRWITVQSHTADRLSLRGKKRRTAQPGEAQGSTPAAEAADSHSAGSRPPQCGPAAPLPIATWLLARAGCVAVLPYWTTSDARATIRDVRKR